MISVKMTRVMIKIDEALVLKKSYYEQYENRTTHNNSGDRALACQRSTIAKQIW